MCRAVVVAGVKREGSSSKGDWVGAGFAGGERGQHTSQEQTGHLKDCPGKRQAGPLTPGQGHSSVTDQGGIALCHPLNVCFQSTGLQHSFIAILLPSLPKQDVVPAAGKSTCS